MRVVIVDVTHMFYRYAMGQATPLSCLVNIGGNMEMVDTTIPALTVKQIHRWANGGGNPTVICFDSRGCNRARRAYFQKVSGKVGDGNGVSYKEGRQTQDNRFYIGAELTFDTLRKGGVVCLKHESYEADDLIYVAVQAAKKKYPDTPIDIITGDSDLLPLVDEQVSVFHRAKTTYAVSKDLEKLSYVQVTPDNYESYISNLSAFKNLYVPYNTILLTKMLRGDKKDAIPGYPKFTPTKLRNLVWSMAEDNVDLQSVFRYVNPNKRIVDRETGEELSEDLQKFKRKEDMMVKYDIDEKLDELCSVLSPYLDQEVVEHALAVYCGLNLNMFFAGLGQGNDRGSATMTAEVRGYAPDLLQDACDTLKIKLPYIK